MVVSAFEAAAHPGWAVVRPSELGYAHELAVALRGEELLRTLDDAPLSAPLARLRQGLADGTLVLLRRTEIAPLVRQPGDGAGDEDDATDLKDLAEDETDDDTDAPPGEPLRPTWIEINIVDLDDAPIDAHAFRLILSDGSMREGTLGADGRIRFDDVTAGLCTLVLPTADEHEWEPAEAG